MKLISLKILILSGCSNLEEFNLTPQNLEELYLDGTAIKELPAMIGNLQKLVLFTLKDCKRLTTLPDSIGNLKALQKFVLSGCKNFKIFPEVKENMKHLKTLLLDGTAIQEMPRLLKRFIVNQGETSSCSDCRLREWPHEIYTLSSVQRLSLSRNSFRSLPKNISFLYNLKWLDLKYCEQLISLPVLPPSLHWLDAHGCVALEDIESPLALILAETEHSHSTFAFTNCTKLDQVAKNGIISYVWRKIQLMSDALAHQEKGSKLNVLIRVCYPGWQVPVWFNHRTVGSELKQKLHRHWNEAGLTGIALCAVVSFKNYQAQNNRLLVRCNIDFKEEDEPLKQFSCNLGGWTEHGKDRPRDIIKSFGHVFVGYTNLLHIKKRDIEAECLATEASFKFEVTDGTKQITDCEVLKCGFTLICAPTKPVHRLYTEKHTDHDEITPGSTTKSEGNINSKESHFQIRNEATSVPSVALPMGCETRKKVESLEGKSSVAPSTSNGEEAPSTSNRDEAPSVVSYNATPNICDSMRAESVSPGSSGSEVIDEKSPENDEESPNNDETNQEVKNTTCFSFFQHFTTCLR
ncbi:ADP-ribosyl cyclase/cyclic ADP-ribose hydrolase [Hirschfeldia incana]|nr:ADP-ribosyl cyclase/cyclic ADP-ribose hydrolase [Hirschfeldia incana]